MACMDISVTSGSEQNRECNFDKEVQKKKRQLVEKQSLNMDLFSPLTVKSKANYSRVFASKGSNTDYATVCELKALLFVTKAKSSLAVTH